MRSEGSELSENGYQSVTASHSGMTQGIKTPTAWRARNRLRHHGSRRPCKPQHEEAEIEHPRGVVGWAEDGVEDVKLLAPIGVRGVGFQSHPSTPLGGTPVRVIPECLN